MPGRRAQRRVDGDAPAVRVDLDAGGCTTGRTPPPAELERGGLRAPVGGDEQVAAGHSRPVGELQRRPRPGPHHPRAGTHVDALAFEHVTQHPPAGGTTADPPVAITNRSARSRRPSSVSSVCGSTKWTWAGTSSMPSQASSSGDSSFPTSSTVACTRFITAGKSTSTSARKPYASPPRAPAIRLAVSSNVLLGTQPSCVQSPPGRAPSTSATRRRGSPQLAPRAAARPVAPAPITTRSCASPTSAPPRRRPPPAAPRCRRAQRAAHLEPARRGGRGRLRRGRRRAAAAAVAKARRDAALVATILVGLLGAGLGMQLGGTVHRAMRGCSPAPRPPSALPAYEPDDRTIRLLHVSDIHLNPAAYDLMASVITQFTVAAVVDTGDSTDYGSELENRTLGRIGRLGVQRRAARAGRFRRRGAARRRDPPGRAAHRRSHPRARPDDGPRLDRAGRRRIGSDRTPREPGRPG